MGPPRSGAGPRTGPWRKGKAQDRRGLTQAALRVVRSPGKGIIGVGGMVTSRQGHGRRRRRSELMTREGREDSS